MANIINRDPFDDLLQGFFVRPVEFGRWAAEAPQMRVDLSEDDAAYRVHAELPGVNKDDIHVSIDGAVLSISAERKQEKEVKQGEKQLRTERYFGKVSRSFQLGQEVDEARATAKFKDGVLELHLPKKAAAQARRLTIE
jgi:HSP20 family protein